MRRLTLPLSLLLIGAACAGADRDPVVTAGREGAPRAARHTATTTVLESPDHGPELCLGGVLTSLPPQCGGPAVLGWDWEVVGGEKSVDGTTWGTFTVTGTWDGDAHTLTLTERPTTPGQPAPAERGQTPASTPCPAPEGGWGVVDGSTTSDASLQAAIDHARSEPTVGGVWVDQSINPAVDGVPRDESRVNDPSRLVLNVSFTGDLGRQEGALREIWGGALCVSKASRGAVDRARIRAEVEAEVATLLFSSVDEIAGRVEIGVPVDDGLQQRFDERYGTGVVSVQPQLRAAGS